MKYTTFETLTVNQYQQLYSIHRGESEDTDKIIQSVCVLTGLSEKGVEDMPLPDFNRVAGELAVIFKEKAFTSLRNAKPKSFIHIAGKTYGVNYKPSTLSAGQYIEVQTWMRSNVIENMNKIMASIVYPVKGRGWFKKRLKYDAEKHPEISEQILECNFIDVHAACVFFSKLWRDSINSLTAFLEKEAKRKGMNPEQLRTLLRNVSAGFLTPNELQILKTSR